MYQSPKSFTLGQFSRGELRDKVFKDRKGEYVILQTISKDNQDYVEGFYIDKEIIRTKFQRLDSVMNDEFIRPYQRTLESTSTISTNV